ncbi:MAG: DUF5686 and carboxypeptidase regulatory-like domain-containing protein [Bacteroidota bacterium]
MKHPYKIFLLLSLLLTIYSASDSFGFSIKGSVTDIKGNSIAYATIFIKELNKGVTTGEKGNFTIPVENGSYSIKFQCVGYQPELKSVVVNNSDVEIKVILKEMNYTLNEVVISGKENPANRIMRATITRAQFFFKMLESYNADVYVKVNFKIDKLSALVKYMTKDEKEIPKIGKLQFAESHNLVSYLAPNHYTQKVLKAEKSGSAFGPDGIPGVQFLAYSVYEPKYGDIPSPLGRSAFSYYNFYLAGISVMGNYSIYKIKVSPKRPGIFFEGYVYINSSNYFVNNLDWKLDASFQNYTLKMDFDVFQDVIALPSSYYIDFHFEMMGNKLSGMSSSSLRYTTLKLNEKARIYAKESKSDEIPAKAEKRASIVKKQQKLEDEVSKLMNKKEMSLKDMNKFMRTMKKLDKASEKDTSKSLEVKDPVVVIKDSLYNKHDTLYWQQVRPVTLSREERVAEHEIDSVYRVKLSDTVAGKAKKDSLHKVKFSDLVTRSLLGGNLHNDSTYQFHVSGLLGNNTYFTAVDGFTLGASFSYSRFSEKKNKRTEVSYTPSYSFIRQELMTEARIGRTFSRKKQASIFIDVFSKSRDFNTQYPVDLFLNSISSLFLFDNKVKQIHDQGFKITGKLELTNGLISTARIEYHNREILENTTNYSFSKIDTIYKPNNPLNVYQSNHPLANHEQFFLQFGLEYTHRNKYMIKNNRKLNLGSSYPVLGVNYIQGIEGIGKSASNFSSVSISIEQRIDLGLFSEIWYKGIAGNSFNTDNLQIPDFYHPNVTAFVFDFRDTKSSFLLMPSYVYSTPSWFVDTHFHYKSSCLIFKRLPWIGEKLFTETITLAYFHSEKYPNYIEAAYGFGNILFAGSIQAVVGYENGKYKSWGIRAFFGIK